MSQAVALAVLEVVALLLTLLFFAVQYVSRNLLAEAVPEETLASAIDAVVNASFFLTMAALMAAVVVFDTTDDSATFLAIVFLYLAFAVIAVAIRNAAGALADAIDENESTGGFNSDADQATIEDYNR